MSIKEEYPDILNLRNQESEKQLTELPDHRETSHAIKGEIA